MTIAAWAGGLLAADEAAGANPWVYLAVGLCLLLTGPGTLALDYCLFGRRRADVGPPTMVRL